MIVENIYFILIRIHGYKTDDKKQTNFQNTSKK